jgi:aerobic carbon-monoxide dehydrogenase medium subunit
MLLREVEYVRPTTLEDAVRLLGEHDGARALAGGQTLINVMKQRAASPDVLVDLGRIGELRTIGFSADETALELGAMVTLSQLMTSSEVEVARPVLAEVVKTVADVQVRNRGTIGGNICVNDPTNHLPPLVVALDAAMTIRSTAGERTISADDFFVGVYETAVVEGDLLTRVSIPTRTPGSGDAMSGVTLGAHGTYVANAAASVAGGQWRIALGCIGGIPVRATAVEERLAGVEISEQVVADAVAGLGATLDPPSDVHGTADYRRALSEIAVTRAVLQAAERARGV